MAQIFFSYSRVDTAFVERLIRRVQQAFPHLTLWYDQSPHGLIGGDNWWDEILKAIAASDIFIYVLSNESVKSLYCQAEFTEARRLQKRIITIQARDRTELTDDLDDIQFIDMKNGTDDPDALTRLYAAISKQLGLAGQARPLWKPATPKPQKEPQPTRRPDAPEVDTPPLTPPSAEQEALKVARSGLRWQIGLGVATLAVTLLVAVLGLLPWLSERAASANATQTAEAVTQLALALTSSITPTPSLTATDAPTLTPAPTLEIGFIVQTLDAQATIDQATAYVQASAAARATVYAVGTQSMIDQTATATLWTNTPTPNMTASIEAFRTQQAATTTAQFITGQTATAAAWTDTPFPTPTPTNTPTLSPEQLALTPVTRNADWQPYERDFDGVTMVLVPVGCFMMGSEDFDDEKPPHEQCFDEPFWLDKTEVTNAQFAAFNGIAGHASNWRGENRPREQINWFEARDFCALRDARLPTEVEWEYSARGPDGLVYPWGNDWKDNSAVWGGNSNNQTVAVGSRPSAVSWVGALDMSGNVWEWVSSFYFAYPYDKSYESDTDNGSFRVLRGGSWGNVYANDLRMPGRLRYNPEYQNAYVGFRCARDFEMQP